MAKASWQGYISLGQLGIPVRLYNASQPARPNFVQLHEKDGSKVERILQCKDEHKQINIEEVVRAVEYEPGRFVTLSNNELELASSSPVKTIDVKQFTGPESVEPIYYEKPYYMVPTRGGERAYALLREVFIRSGKIAVTQFTIYNKERIGVLMVQDDLITLLQLRYAAEIVPRSSIKTPALPKPSPSEIEALSSVIDRYSGAFYIQDFHDENVERINQLVERKIKGLPVPSRERIAPLATPEGEIVEALRESLGPEESSGGVVKSK
jgi:DNA end-binding protein Ku